MKQSDIGEKLTKHYESCRLEAYQDDGGVWTIGFGTTHYRGGKPVQQGDKIPQWRADELYKDIVFSFEGNVTRLLKGVYIQQHQFDALVDFAYNVGMPQFESSTLLKVVRNNPNDLKAIDKQFRRWIFDDGKVIPGLINRRESESWLYCNNELKFFNVPGNEKNN